MLIYARQYNNVANVILEKLINLKLNEHIFYINTIAIYQIMRKWLFVFCKKHSNIII